MALSPYINETVLTASIESVVPLDAQGILTQVIATSTYDLGSGTHIYTVKVTDGVLQYQVGRKQAASASTCVGISFNGRDGTATFNITPTAEGYTYKAAPITNFYGSVNSETKMANKIYGSVEQNVLSGVTGEIRNTSQSYGHLVFNAGDFFSQVESLIDLTKTPETLELVTSHHGDRSFLTLNYQEGGSYSFGDIDIGFGQPTSDGFGLYWAPGFSPDYAYNTDYIDLTPIYSTGMRTKLIHQGFGHFPYYGQIVYYTDASHTDTGVILLKNQSQIDQLHGDRQGWETEIEGVQLSSADIKEVYIGKQAESIPQAFLIACSSIDTVDLSESEITSIPGNFMKDCSNFNGTLKLPPTTQTIGSLFLYKANHFNQPLTIPTGVTSINYNFLYNASDFNQPITLPPSLVSLGYQFLYGCNKMTSTVNVGSLSADIATYNDRTLATNSSSAAMYRTGVTIAGANRAAWLAKFPNNNSVPFRKLVDAGY